MAVFILRPTHSTTNRRTPNALRHSRSTITSPTRLSEAHSTASFVLHIDALSYVSDRPAASLNRHLHQLRQLIAPSMRSLTTVSAACARLLSFFHCSQVFSQCNFETISTIPLDPQPWSISSLFYTSISVQNLALTCKLEILISIFRHTCCA